jgi:hypothetical protein
VRTTTSQLEDIALMQRGGDSTNLYGVIVELAQI